MFFNELFPTIIGEKVLDNISNSDIFQYKEYLNKAEYISDGGANAISTSRFTKDQNILQNPLFKNLNQEILKLSKEYLDKIKIIYQDIQIVTSWGVKVNKGERGTSHNHPNSLISGVYYLTNNSQIQLYSPSNPLWFFQSEHIDSAIYNSLPNTLILFPSFLEHRIVQSKENERLSIAFNIIPKGEFGGYTTKIYL